jgi:hypothetical protein
MFGPERARPAPDRILRPIDRHFNVRYEPQAIQVDGTDHVQRFSEFAKPGADVYNTFHSRTEASSERPAVEYPRPNPDNVFSTP